MKLPEETTHDIWLKKEDIPDNTLFFSLWSGFDEKDAAHHMVKFEGEFYAFDQNDVLFKLSEEHPFLSISSFNKVQVENIQKEDLDDLWQKYIHLSTTII